MEVMNSQGKECEQCGGSLYTNGRCSVCGAPTAKFSDGTQKSISERMEGLFSLPKKGNQKIQGAVLIQKGTSERHHIDQPVIKIGRDHTNSISLPKDSYISRHHAWVLYINGSYWVEDLGSTNGTLLNGEVLNERRQIFPGDCVKVGQTELVFELS